MRTAKTLIRLGRCPGWSNAVSDQTGWMPRLIWVFTGCTVILLVLSQIYQKVSLSWESVMLKMYTCLRVSAELKVASLGCRDVSYLVQHLQHMVYCKNSDSQKKCNKFCNIPQIWTMGPTWRTVLQAKIPFTLGPILIWRTYPHIEVSFTLKLGRSCSHMGDLFIYGGPVHRWRSHSSVESLLHMDWRTHLSQLTRLWYLSHRRPAKAQVSLRISAVSPEPSLFAHIKYRSRRRVRPKDGCTCVFEEWFTEDEKYNNLMTWPGWGPSFLVEVSLTTSRNCSKMKVSLIGWDPIPGLLERFLFGSVQNASNKVMKLY